MTAFDQALAEAERRWPAPDMLAVRLAFAEGARYEDEHYKRLMDGKDEQTETRFRREIEQERAPVFRAAA